MFAVSFSNKADGSLQIGAGETFLVKELTDRLLVMALLPVPITDAHALAIAVLKDDKAEVETALAKLIDETLGSGLEPKRKTDKEMMAEFLLTMGVEVPPQFREDNDHSAHMRRLFTR